jgi:two-component system chemotaxis sensor kinase CheA
MVDLQFLPSFLDEAEETLQQWESVCLKIEKQSSHDLQNELFRCAHNIKGSSKSVGLIKFSDLVHKAEDVITRIKSGALSPTPQVIGVLLDCQKVLVMWIDRLRTDPDYLPDMTDLLKLLSWWATHEKFPEELRSNKEMLSPSESGFTLFEELAGQDAVSSSRDIGTILMDSGKVSAEQIESAVKLQNRKLGEVLIDNGVVDQKAVNAALEIQKQSGLKIDETIRVSLRKLDGLIRLVGELSIQHSIIRNAKDEGSLTDSHALEAITLAHKVIQDLQGEAMSLRMQPLEGLFQRMERVSRDVARQQNKSLKITLKGTEVELDRTVIEQMKDPLVHILRNAVDHGIEEPAQRKSCGKPETAEIVIEGIQTASNVSIRISDDGRGLDETKILKKALEKGLVSPTASLTKEDVHDLIFMPGFSTAEKLTDVSGRGVGLDVVKRAVDELGGTVQIDSTFGAGTSFLISLPSTLSVLDAIVVGLEKKLYSVPVQDVEEVVDLANAQVETTSKKGRIINLRGRVIPVEPLSSWLNMETPRPTDEVRGGGNIALVTRHHSLTVAFAVDCIAGQQSIVVRKLEGKLSLVPGFAGGTILSSGEPAMIVHLPQIVKSFASTLKGA